MWPFDAALLRKIATQEGQLVTLEARLADAEKRLRQQGELILQYRVWSGKQPAPPGGARLCLCGDRWFFWRDRDDVGEDGLPNSSDEDPTPDWKLAQWRSEKG